MAKSKGVKCIALCNLRIREDLAKRVLQMLEDPVKPGRTEYGSMRRYMETLIAEDMHKRQAISTELLKEIVDESAGN